METAIFTVIESNAKNGEDLDTLNLGYVQTDSSIWEDYGLVCGGKAIGTVQIRHTLFLVCNASFTRVIVDIAVVFAPSVQKI